jgi:ketosteroid isomerase-like protein
VLVQDQRCTAVRKHYADITDELDRLWALCASDIVFHVAGTHPLSGSYFGRDAVRTYIDAVRRVPGDHPGFTIASVLEDTHRNLLLVEGTARHGTPAFVRTVVHVLRFRDGLLTEFWDYPFDQEAEDIFWRTSLPPRIPVQRSRVRASPPPTPPLHQL